MKKKMYFISAVCVLVVGVFFISNSDLSVYSNTDDVLSTDQIVKFDSPNWSQVTLDYNMVYNEYDRLEDSGKLFYNASASEEIKNETYWLNLEAIEDSITAYYMIDQYYEGSYGRNSVITDEATDITYMKKMMTLLEREQNYKDFLSFKDMRLLAGYIELRMPTGDTQLNQRFESFYNYYEDKYGYVEPFVVEDISTRRIVRTEEENDLAAYDLLVKYYNDSYARTSLITDTETELRYIQKMNDLLEIHRDLCFWLPYDEVMTLVEYIERRIDLVQNEDLLQSIQFNLKSIDDRYTREVVFDVNR